LNKIDADTDQKNKHQGTRCSGPAGSRNPEYRNHPNLGYDSEQENKNQNEK
jgi:hypothetical protein